MATERLNFYSYSLRGAIVVHESLEYNLRHGTVPNETALVHGYNLISNSILATANTCQVLEKSRCKN